MLFILCFLTKEIIFKMRVTLICFNLIKGKLVYSLLPAFNMNRMKIYNLLYKIQKAKSVKSGVVDRL